MKAQLFGRIPESMCFVVQNSICEISYGDGGGNTGMQKSTRTIYECIDGGDTAPSFPPHRVLQRHTMRVVWVIGCADISKNSNYG